MPLRLFLMASGRGSNVKAILEAIHSGDLDAEVVGVLSNVAEAPVLAMAESYGVPNFCVPHHGLKRRVHEAQVWSVIEPLAYDYVVLAGYMRLMSAEFLKQLQPTAQSDGGFKVINIHPSLLPAFPGTHAYEQAFDYGVQVSGVTVHAVDDQMDHGPILAQAPFNRAPGDTLESFQAKGLAIEHRLYPQVLAWLGRTTPQFARELTSNRWVLRSPALVFDTMPLATRA